MVTVTGAGMVLHVMREASGGMVTHAVALLGAMVRRGHPVGLAAPAQVATAVCARLGERLDGIGWFALEVQDGRRLAVDGAAAWRLARLASRLHPRVIHAHGYKAALISAMARRVLGGRPRAAGTTWVATVHNPLPRRRLAVARAMDRVAAWWALGQMDRVIAVSESVRSVTPARGAVVIPNGLPAWRLEAADDPSWRPPAPGEPFVFAWAGRLVPSKGVDHILEALSLLEGERPHEVRIAGDGPELEGLAARVETLGLGDRVRFLGWVEDVRAVWTASHAAVFASHQEAFSYAVLEAMACARPVIVTAGTGCEELVRGGAGLVVPAGDVPALAAAMRAILREPARAAAIGRRAKDASMAYTDSAMVERTLAAYGVAPGGAPGAR